MRRTWSVSLVVGVCLVLAAAPGGVLAGSQPDPDLGDTVLGTVDGVRYSREIVDNQPNGYGFATAGCGPAAFKLVGGGGKAGSAVTTWLSDASFRSFPDSDQSRDDGFEQAAHGIVGGTTTAYAICVRDVQTKVVHAELPAGASSERTATIGCGGGSWHAAGGSVFIATSASWLGSSRPWDSGDAGTEPDDGWTGTAYDTGNGGGGLGIFVGCVSGRPVRYVKSAATTVLPGSSVIVTASCAADEHVIGGGQSMSGLAADTRAIYSKPQDGTDTGTVPDDGWTAKVRNVSGVSRTVRAWASCLG